MAENFDISVLIKIRDNISSSLMNISSKLKATSAQVKAFSSSMRDFGNTINTRVTLPFTVLSGVALNAFNKQEKAVAQIRIGLQSTGNAAKKTIDELTKSASDLQKKTLFGDEEILAGVTAQLLTFTNIAGKSFDRTQKAVLDVATRLAAAKGGTVDLTSTAIQLGKALNDPVKNLSALSRSGIQFSESQIEVIKKLVETGHIVSAQKLILTELEKQYGGSAEEAAKAGTGGLTQLKNSIGDLLETIGQILYQYLDPFIKKLKSLTERFDEFSKQNPNIIKIGLAIGALVSAIGLLVSTLGILGFAISGIMTGFAALAPIIAVALGAITPFTLGIIALIAVIAALVIYRNEIFDFFKGVGMAISEWAMPYIDAFAEKITAVMDRIRSFKNSIAGIFGSSSESTGNVNNNKNSNMSNPIVSTALIPKPTTVAIPPMSLGKGQTDINIKLSAPDGMSAKVSSAKDKGNGGNVKFISESYLGNTQMIPGLF